MTTFDDLDGAFSSLADTLQNRYTLYLPVAQNARWLGAMAAAAAVARDVDAWNALPREIPEARDLIDDIDAAARALASGSRKGDHHLLDALDGVDRVLANLRSFLSQG